MGLLERPGLYGLHEGLRRVRGPTPPSLSQRPYSDRQAVRLAAWLELSLRVRFLFDACLNPHAPQAAMQAIGGLADPARVWLWLAYGVRTSGRREALQLGERALPHERDAFRTALGVLDRLHLGPPAPLPELLPSAIRVTRAVGELLASELEPAGSTEVALLGALEGDEGVPLADWRALVVPRLHRRMPASERLVVVDADPGDPEAIASAARAAGGPAVPALRADSLLVQPAAEIWGVGRLRGLQVEATDPVSFALLEGKRVARFPDVVGWSAQDLARRAVSEHRAWLESPDWRLGEPPGWVGRRPGPKVRSAGSAGMLVSAVRAALFRESLERGEPQLVLTLAAAAEALGEVDPPAGRAAQAILELAPGDPPSELALELERGVRALWPYSGAVDLGKGSGR
jgi:hypothetical protein